MAFLRYAVVALMLTSAPVAAQDFDAGLEAATKGDFATALREWRPLAEQGYPGAQYNLGVMYEKGNGVVQDYAEAVRWYRLAAEQGNASAQNDLGAMYTKGDGVVQDYGSAHMWFNIAAANGDGRGGRHKPDGARDPYRDPPTASATVMRVIATQVGPKQRRLDRCVRCHEKLGGHSRSTALSTQIGVLAR